MITPVIWDIIEWPKARDGDSVYLVRQREIARDPDQILLRRDPKPVLCRLVWLDTPEISGPKADPANGRLATGHAQSWLNAAWGVAPPLTAVQYGEEKYGRPLVDIRAGDESLSIWMVTTMGWEPYIDA